MVVNFTVKVLLTGDSGVGKSSVLLRFADDSFDEEQSATIGLLITKSN